MTNQALHSAPALSFDPRVHDGTGATWAEVGDLIRRFCADRGRHGFRLGGRERSGHLFIDQGHVVHAEYGEDFGLSAILELLKAGPMRLETWPGAWPLHGSLRLSPERLQLQPAVDANPPLETRVVRKVTLPPPPARTLVRPRQAAASEAPLRRAPAPRPEAPVTTMVRLSPRGVVFAARGKDAARLADAAALIHSLSKLIARDLAQRGPAFVHVQGQKDSLLVMRSEVNDIAAAYGPTCRLSVLLGKAGVR